MKNNDNLKHKKLASKNEKRPKKGAIIQKNTMKNNDTHKKNCKNEPPTIKKDKKTQYKR